MLRPHAKRLGRAGGRISSTLRLVWPFGNGDWLSGSHVTGAGYGDKVTGMAALVTGRESRGRQMTLEMLGRGRKRLHQRLERPGQTSNEDREQGSPTRPGRLGEGSKPKPSGERFCGMAEPCLDVVEGGLICGTSLSKCCRHRRSISAADRCGF